MCFCFFQIWFALYSFVVGVKEWRILRLSKERDLKPIFLLFASFVFVFYFPYLSTPTMSAPPNIFSNFQVSTS